VVVENFCVYVDIQQAQPNRLAEEVEATFGVKAQAVGNVLENFQERQVRSPDGFE